MIIKGNSLGVCPLPIARVMKHFSGSFIVRQQESRNSLPKSRALRVINQGVAFRLQTVSKENKTFLKADKISIEERHRPHVIQQTTIDGTGFGATPSSAWASSQSSFARRENRPAVQAS